MPPTNGQSAYMTVQIKRKGGTTMIRPRLRTADEGTPRVASQRAYLRAGLPALYQEGDFGTRFVGAFEIVLDPIFGVLDCLPPYFRADLAPRDVLELLAAWLGIDVDESWSEDIRRRLVRHAAELSRRRGTKQGLQLMLSIAFPDLPLRVEDEGNVTWGTDANAPHKAKEPLFYVYCDQQVREEVLATIARVIEQSKPVHVGYKLRVKSVRPKTQQVPKVTPPPPPEEPEEAEEPETEG